MTKISLPHSLRFALVLLSLFAGAQAEGAVILSDTFSYPDGALVTAAGSPWTTYSGTAGQVAVVSGRAFLNKTNTEDVHAALAGSPYASTATNVLYASFTVNFSALPTSGGDYFANFKAGGTSNQRARVFAGTAGAASGFFRLGIAVTNTSPTAVFPADLALNSNYTVVVRYAVSNTAAALWISPAVETDGSVTASDLAAGASISYFGFRENGSAMGNLSVDNLLVGTAFTDVLPPANTTPTITSQPQNQSVTVGDNATFAVTATGSAPLSYQWKSNNVAVAGATNTSFTLTNVTIGLNASTYAVTVTNLAGSTNSQPATLNVAMPVVLLTNSFSYLTYNVNGNGQTNWTTNSPQVQAFAREIQYLKPDIITFNEIPQPYVYEMTNFVAAFLPGYYLATNSVGDGYIRNCIVSRFPITYSASHLHSSNLDQYGYTNSNFSRDLFEAQIAMPGFPLPLHVFVAHLKATTTSPQDDANKRAAEAAAVSNYFTATYLAYTNSTHPYILSGDMNESALYPDSSYASGHPIQTLVATPTGLQYTDPLNSITHTDLTESIRLPLDTRFDYIFPCGILFSNIVSSQVFRTDLLSPLPSGLNSNDDSVASDHLPVLMVFNNPYGNAFRITSLTFGGTNLNFNWQSFPGVTYRLDSSTNLSAWTTRATNLLATNFNASSFVNATNRVEFFRLSHTP